MTRIERQALHLVAFALAAAAASAVAVLRTTPVLAQASPAPAASESTTAAIDDLRPVERAFILGSVEIARLESELSRLAVSQSTSSSVRELAQQLASDYSGMSLALETLARRKAVAVPLQPASYGDEYRGMASRAGREFDASFIREIADASQRALRLSESAVANAKDPDVRQLAGSLLPTLRDHVNKSTQLLQEL